VGGHHQYGVLKLLFFVLFFCHSFMFSIRLSFLLPLDLIEQSSFSIEINKISTYIHGGPTSTCV